MNGSPLAVRSPRLMRLFASAFVLLALLLLAADGCSGFLVFSNGRLLAVITINPSSADPLNFPNNTVSFVATGSFNNQPSPITPLPNVLWTVGAPFFSGGVPNSGQATIDQNGNATCAAGFTGSIQVFATAPVDFNQPVSITNQKVGAAQLICP
jgi:hypothetical protein